MSATKQFLFIAPSVSGWQTIADSAGAAVRIVVLDATRDGLTQIAAALADEHDLAAIHIVSHGGAGQISLGSATIGADELARHGAALAQIGASLRDGGDILLYGCDVAQGAAGSLFVSRLAQATGADVEASTDLTGAAALGGDWTLEAQVGTIEAAALVAVGFAGTLALVNGTAGDDWLDGTTGADTINGNGGDDTLRSSAGNDTLNGGADSVYGDTVDYSQGPGGVTVNLATGKATDNWGDTDTLAGIEHITGSGFNDTLTGSTATNWFRPGAGNDTVVGNGGFDVVMYEGTTAPMTVDLKAGTATGAEIGTDKLTGIRNVHTGRGADTVTLTDLGGYVFSRGGDDVLKGGLGDDTFYSSSGNDKITGGGGRDVVRYWDEYSDDPNSVLTNKGVTVDLVTGIAIDNWGDTDTLSGVGNVGGSRFDDMITGDASDNDLQSADGNDTLNGGGGADQLHGGAGVDRLDGGDGNDSLIAGAGNDIVAGAGGSDRVEYFNENGGGVLTGLGVTVNLLTGTATDNWGDTDTLSGVEDVAGSRHADTISGDAGRNSVEGREGDDTIYGNGDGDWLRGGDGNDKIDGGDGRDTLIGSHGNDTLTGGADYDRIEYWDESGPVPVTGNGVKVNLATGIATDNWGGTDTLSGIEDAAGSRYGDTITGNAENNNIDGQEGADTINGGAGYDWLRGGAGNDTLDGGADNDRADYQNDFGDSKVTGIGVIVNLVTGTATDNWGHIDKLIGIEDVTGSRYADTITGDAGNNTLEAQEGNDTVSAGRGDDWLRGGDGDDQLDGGTGRDRIDYYWDYGDKQPTGLGVTVDLAAGKATDNWGNTDTLTSIEDATGSHFGDVLTGSAVDNILEGREGNDTLIGGAGYDSLSGGAGNDTLDGGADRDRVDYWGESYPNGAGIKLDLAAGTATDSWGNADTLVSIEDVGGTRRGDVIAGSGTDNNLNGYDGTDTLSGGAGYDYLVGGAGNDTIDGGADRDQVGYADTFGDAAALAAGVTVNLTTGIATDNWGNTDTLVSIEDVTGSRYGDSITGNTADNSLNGNDGNDTIVAGDGNDWLTGGNGVDNLQGGDGYDNLTGGAGNDTLHGGAGRDSVRYSDDFEQTVPITKLGVKVNLVTGVATDNWGHTDKLIDIEDVTGSRYADSIVGSSANNSVQAGEGNDVVSTGAGNDYLDGGDGNDNLKGGDGYDSLVGGAGADTLDGGNGSDTISYNSENGALPISGKGVTVNLVTGTAIDNWGNTDKLLNVESADGSRFADTLTGNAADNNLTGDSGDDKLIGAAGNDWLDGGSGNDILQGGDGDDYFIGGAGNDTIVGGTGINMVVYYRSWDPDNTPTTGNGITVDLNTGIATDLWGHTDKLTGIQGVGGSDLDDKLTGNAGDNSLYGGAGNDILMGGGGYDNLSGEAGNDTIDGGAITDLINYTDGNAVSFFYYELKSGVLVNLATNRAYDGLGGVDTLANINEVVGTDFDDAITGSSRAVLEIFLGGRGDDVINGGAVTDRVNDTNGNRVAYLYADKAVEVDLALGTATGGDGNDTLSNITQVFGSAHADVLRGSDTDLVEQFYGAKGDDLIDGRGGLDQVRYAEAAAAVNVNLATGVALDGDGGTDKLVDIEGVRGSQFDDTLIGGNTDNGIDDEGLEFFSGERGDDLIDGGAGFDRADYTTSVAAVKVTLGGTGAGSALDGFGGTDTLRNIEAVRGSNFGDTLTGSATGAFEAFEGRGGNDVIDGKGGIDLADYSTATVSVNVNLATGTATDGLGGTDKLSNIEWVRGSLAGNDVLTGNTLANRLEGLGGNDTLNGGTGADTMIGGDGSDTYYVDNAGDIVTETSARSSGGIDRVFSNISYKLGTNVENLILQAGNINGTGNALNNVIVAGAGLNTIDGGAGTDTLSFETAAATATSGTAGVRLTLGAAGSATAASGISGADKVLNIENVTGSKYNDVLTGNSGANTLNGGAGADTLNGGAGKDVLTGGAGADVFVFNTALGSTNVDTVTDFATVDTIRLENAVFTKLAATGTLAAASFRIGAAALDANDFILYDKASGYVSYDADGNGAGAAVKVALVGTNLALTNADFVVI